MEPKNAPKYGQIDCTVNTGKPFAGSLSIPFLR